VGRCAATPPLAVEHSAAGWRAFGGHDLPGARRLLILGDAPGRKGYRPRLGKHPLQERVADPLGWEVTVGHDPSGAAQGTPLEHPLFGPLSVKWAAQPLVTCAALLALIRATLTQTGLNIEAFLVAKL
jgi:hypothetical protein